MVQHKNTLTLVATLLAMTVFSSSVHAGGMPYEEQLQQLESELQQAAKEREAVKAPTPQKSAPAKQMPEPLNAEETEIKTKTATEDTKPPKPGSKSLFSSINSQSGYMGLSIGYFDANNNNKAISFGAEWQSGVRIAKVLQPLIGGLVTTDGNYFGYVGMGLPIKMGPKVTLTPSLAIGALGGGEADLGQTITYRMGGELAYLLENDSRIGLVGQIITNGSSFNSNDRIEVISLNFSKPLGQPNKPASGM